jgi:hypothetical protein
MKITPSNRWTSIPVNPGPKWIIFNYNCSMAVMLIIQILTNAVNHKGEINGGRENNKLSNMQKHSSLNNPKIYHSSIHSNPTN